MSITRVYDGSPFCKETCDKCPVVDYDAAEGAVVIHDPHKPENGRMKMTVAEFNALIGNARPIA